MTVQFVHRAWWQPGDPAPLDLRDWPIVWQGVGGFLILSLARYWVHRLFHASDSLWTLHRVHHSDPRVTASTTFRHHPLETVLAVALAYPVLWLMPLHEHVLSAVAVTMLTLDVIGHLPMKSFDWCPRWVSWILPTPAFHHLHHQRASTGANANYSDVLPLWDLLFGTYRRSDGDAVVHRVGIHEFRDVDWAVLMESPFSKRNDGERER